MTGGFRTVLLQPAAQGRRVLPAGRRHRNRIRRGKIPAAHALMQAMHGGEYICDFEMGAKVDGIINAVLKSVKSGTREKC